jgi:transposase
MTTLDGVKNILGCRFMAAMGELSNFKSYKSLIAYMGFDPSTNQSGKHVGPSKISKRGNRHMKRITHIMTQ